MVCISLDIPEYTAPLQLPLFERAVLHQVLQSLQADMFVTRCALWALRRLHETSLTEGVRRGMCSSLYVVADIYILLLLTHASCCR